MSAFLTALTWVGIGLLGYFGAVAAVWGSVVVYRDFHQQKVERLAMRQLQTADPALPFNVEDYAAEAALLEALWLAPAARRETQR